MALTKTTQEAQHRLQHRLRTATLLKGPRSLPQGLWLCTSQCRRRTPRPFRQQNTHRWTSKPRRGEPPGGPICNVTALPPAAPSSMAEPRPAEPEQEGQCQRLYPPPPPARAGSGCWALRRTAAAWEHGSRWPALPQHVLGSVKLWVAFGGCVVPEQHGPWSWSQKLKVTDVQGLMEGWPRRAGQQGD